MAAPTRDEILKRVQRGEKLDRADLRGLDLSRARLVKAIFDRSDLDGANLEAAELSGASLRRDTLREAYLVGADLSGANLENADLEGAKLDRANLSKVNLTRANLEGASLTGADLTGAQLSYAQLATAKLGGARLAGAIFTHAELDEAYLGAASAAGAKFDSVRLAGADLEGAILTGASFDDADLRGAILRNADLTKASLVKTDLTGADLTGANLIDTDIRHATFTNAKLSGTKLTGAKVAGLVGTGSPIGVVDVTWLDLSPAGDGTQRVENGIIPSLLSVGAIVNTPSPADQVRRRYFGRGDVLLNATLQFDAGARVEIDSLFQNCVINLGERTELIIGAAGVLADCQIVGAGHITVHGKFFERSSPGIVGPRQLMVTAGGAVVAAVAQNAELTQFGFESGCQLRLKIVGDKQQSDKHEVKR